jgi:homoserine dehydrogenase
MPAAHARIERSNAVEAPQPSAPFADTYHTSGTSPTTKLATARTEYRTVHLLGAGAVGRAFLELLAGSRRVLVAVTDSTATIHAPGGLDPLSVASWKAAGRPLREHTAARALPVQRAVAQADADIVIDASATELSRAGWTEALSQALARGACIVLAAKAALCEAGAEWLNGPHRNRIGCHAVLGGTGRQFVGELTELQRRWRGVAIVGNASTTTMLEAIERGATLAEASATARQLGYLEADPELDFRGVDAAVKLAIVASVLTGRRIDPARIPCEDIRTLDPGMVAERARRGCTTRLVARLSGAGAVRVGYEEVARDCVLAARAGQVVYDYRLTRGERRLHVGSGIGPGATADALWSDLQALIASHAGVTTRAAVGGAL